MKNKKYNVIGRRPGDVVIASLVRLRSKVFDKKTKPHKAAGRSLNHKKHSFDHLYLR